MNSQIVTVNLVPGLSTPAVIRVSQYDVGRPLTIRVLDGTGAASFGSSVTATIVGTKPSGLGFTQSGLITGNTVTLNTTLAMTQECGMIPAEISFTTASPATVIGTANFILAVEPSPHPDGTTDGTQETMANLETRLQGEIDDLSDRIDDIEAGGSGLSQTEKNLILTLFSKAAYAESDAESAYDALENLWTTTTRTITYNLSHVSSSNTTASVEGGSNYTTTLTAASNYTLNTVTVTMGGVDITSTSYSSGTVSIASVTGDIVITAAAGATNPLGYVGANLLMLLDGIANGASGAHNSTISSLVDQSGNSHNWETSTQTVTASTNALVFDGTADLAPTWTSGLSDISTVEVVIDVTSPSTTQCLISGIGLADTAGYNDTTLGSLGIKSSNLLHRTGSTYGCIPITSGRHTYTFVKNGTSWKGYKDGTEVSFSSTTISWKSGYKRLGSFIGQNQDTHSYFFTGSLYSLRYYSAALTAEQIAANYANDSTRFS